MDTPLLAAVRKGDIQIVNDLLAAGAKVDTANRRGSTPLMEADRSSGHEDIVERLLKAGAKAK